MAAESADGGRTAGVAPKKYREIRYYVEKYGADWVQEKLDQAVKMKDHTTHKGWWKNGAIEGGSWAVGILNRGGGRDGVLAKFRAEFGQAFDDWCKGSMIDTSDEMGEF